MYIHNRLNNYSNKSLSKSSSYIAIVKKPFQQLVASVSRYSVAIQPHKSPKQTFPAARAIIYTKRQHDVPSLISIQRRESRARGVKKNLPLQMRRQIARIEEEEEEEANFRILYVLYTIRGLIRPHTAVNPSARGGCASALLCAKLVVSRCASERGCITRHDNERLRNEQRARVLT